MTASRLLITLIVFLLIRTPDTYAADPVKRRLLSKSYDRKTERRIVAKSTGFSYHPPRPPAIYHPVRFSYTGRLRKKYIPASSRQYVNRRNQQQYNRQKFDVPVEYYSRLHAIDPDLTRAVIAAESGGNHLSVSPKGAKGLMQLMPRTASMLGVRNSFNPIENISGGTRYLRSLYDRFGRLDLALWAYNAGPGAVEKGILPDETRAYIRKVYDYFRRFRNQ